MQMLNGPSLPPRSGKADSLVLCLHGYGDSGEGLIGIGREWAAALPDTAFISPNAPEVCEQFAAGYQWFPIRAAAAISTKAFNRNELAQKPAEILDHYIDAQLAHWGVDESRLAVIGFSQGAMMAMYAMPRRKRPCAAVVGYSGLLVDAGGLTAPGIVKMPVLVVHGDADDVVPPACLAEAERGFSAAGFNVETLLRPGLEHGIDQMGLMRGVRFIKEAFETKRQYAASIP